jgi:chemotaxis protein MotB
MSTAGQPQASEDLTFPVARTRTKSGSGGWLWASLLIAIAGGLGYFSFTLHAERANALSALESKTAELAKERAQGKAVTEQLRRVESQKTEQAAHTALLGEQLSSVSAELAAAHTRLDELDAERGEMHEQLAEFKQMTRELSRMIDSGRLQVNFRRGRMIVELPAQVLFPSGSSDLSDDGKEALAQVAKSLRGFKSRNFIVGGHTDNVPVSGRFASNWDLSSARAVTVTGALIRGGLRPEQLVAAGYGEYDPIAKNTSELGKQKNRRIEIILEPRLREFKPAQQAAAKATAKQSAAKPDMKQPSAK